MWVGMSSRGTLLLAQLNLWSPGHDVLPTSHLRRQPSACTADGEEGQGRAGGSRVS